MTRILIVDDHAIVREGLRLILEDEEGLEIVGDAADGEEAIQKTRSLTPDVILLDLVLPDIDGIEVTRRVLATQPGCRILLLTSFAEDTNVVAAMQAGASGYLLKDVLRPDLVSAIKKVMRGEPALHPEAQRKLIHHLTQPPATQTDPNVLTDREGDVLRLLAKGLSNKQIAGQLYITEGTVKGHVSNILAKLHLDDRTQAALYAVRKGFQ